MKTNHANLIKTALLVVFMATASVTHSHDLTNLPATPVEHNKTTGDEERAQQLLRRLGDIRNTDMNKLSKAEKRSLRKEVREIKKELATISGGVYISVGALLLIIVLLILLL